MAQSPVRRAPSRSMVAEDGDAAPGGRLDRVPDRSAQTRARGRLIRLERRVARRAGDAGGQRQRLRGGALVDADSDDPRVVGSRRLVEAVAAEPRLMATGLQTVGVKGWDGMVLALVV